MKNALLLLITFLCTITAYSQNYSYSFKGPLSSDELQSLQAKCEALPFVSACKIQYKVEREGGEIKFRVLSAKERPETSEEFSPISMKQVLLEANLMPLEFIELYD